MCPDCGEESVVPVDWELIKKGYWQVDRFCKNCDKRVNSTFLNEAQVVDYHEKAEGIEAKVMPD